MKKKLIDNIKSQNINYTRGTSGGVTVSKLD